MRAVRFWSILAIAVAAGLLAWPLPGGARDTSVFTDDPYPCSVLSPFPCQPSFCSVLRPGPCQPDINYPFGQNLQLTITSRDSQQPQRVAVAAAPDGKATADKDKEAAERRLNTIGDMFAALRACWVPPAEDESRPGTQLSVRLSFKRNGEVFGKPRVTYATPGLPDSVRQAYWDAIRAAVERCTPLAFTAGLGGALAGRPFAIRFVDRRSAS